MGWDAFSSIFSNPDKHPDFAAAAAQIVVRCGHVDFALCYGGLDISACGKELEDATGVSVYDPDGWTSEMVRAAAKYAEWPVQESLEPDPLMHVLCARAFLETCAKLGLSIRFSW